MSRKKLADWERAALRHQCDYCDAAIGEWCWAKTGKPSGYLHGTRLKQVTGEDNYIFRSPPGGHR